MKGLHRSRSLRLCLRCEVHPVERASFSLYFLLQSDVMDQNLLHFHAPLDEAHAVAGGSKDARICSSFSPFPCIIGPVLHLILLQSKAEKKKD